jgi:broad specificity phosphatase PhoE
MAGKSIANQLGEKGKIFFYFSPYLRTRQTLREILREIDKECIVGMREEPRM